MAFSASPFLQRRLGVGKGWEGTQLGKLAQTTQKILCAMEYYTQIKKNKTKKNSGRERVFQSSHYSEIDWASVCWWDVVSDCLCNTWLMMFFLPFDFFPIIWWAVFTTTHILILPQSSWKGRHKRSRGLPGRQGKPHDSMYLVFHLMVFHHSRTCFLILNILVLLHQAKATRKTKSCFWQVGVQTQAHGRLKIQF